MIAKPALYQKGHFNLKVSTISPWLHNQSAILAGEYFFKDNMSGQLELGYIFRYQPFVIDDGQTTNFALNTDRHNYTLRAEMRFYGFSLVEEKMYLAYQLLYQQGHYLDEGTGCLSTDNFGFCNQEVPDPYNVHRWAMAAHMKYGIQWKAGRWLFDLYGGFGVRYLENTVSNKLPNAFARSRFFDELDVIPDFDRDIRYLGLSFIFGAKVGFSLFH